MKLCKDCAWYSRAKNIDTAGFDQCLCPEIVGIAIHEFVRGEVSFPVRYCESARGAGGLCQWEAFYFKEASK